MRTGDSSQAVQTVVLPNEFVYEGSVFKKDMVKSVLFALCITAFEIALYFVYYLHVFERR